MEPEKLNPKPPPPPSPPPEHNSSKPQLNRPQHARPKPQTQKEPSSPNPPKTPHSSITSDNHKTPKNDRPTHCGGGSAILIKNSIAYHSINIFNSTVDITAIGIEVPSKSITICSLYRPSASSVNLTLLIFPPTEITGSTTAMAGLSSTSKTPLHTKTPISSPLPLATAPMK
ncbi:hypothetical protein TNCT_223481 [Trichonephila clavata]|uniref:Uncharacterized protein n=1 Tax=Trichonephila clavata TaxID=2740835 RepID=A0A8X6H080_TRICU|nr:hypothetical protein TNCT_223481 [Trichonephila clavata]